MPERRSPPPPLKPESLDRMALRYVERFATTRAKLAQYLRRKLRERGWEGDGEPGVEALADRMAELGYVDDRAFADAKAGAMTRRGLGARRVADALRHAGVGDADGAGARAAVAEGAIESALRFARRKRIGPYAAQAAERPVRERHLGAMLRAGHGIDLSRRIVALPPLSHSGEDADAEAQLVLSLS